MIFFIHFIISVLQKINGITLVRLRLILSRIYFSAVRLRLRLSRIYILQA